MGRCTSSASERCPQALNTENYIAKSVDANYYIITFEGRALNKSFGFPSPEMSILLLQPLKHWIMPVRPKLGVMTMLGSFTSGKLAVRLQKTTGHLGG